ncbi:MAG: tyrosine-protein phosphatase [Bacteroidota bacterium]
MDSLLSTQQNFRDLGGIPATDGRKIKPGLLFRSGDFFSLSAGDIGKLETIGLSAIIDFRAVREFTSRPDKLIGTVTEIIHISIHDYAREDSERFLAENNAAGLATLLVGDYRRMITEHQNDFRRFFEVLANTENLPLVYHCAAGKDRTGLATVFLLQALGVDMANIWDNYMATNDYAKSYTRKIIDKVTASGLNGEILLPLLEVRKEYLEAALVEIVRQAGSLQCYVEDVLLADIAVLQSKYLDS